MLELSHIEKSFKIRDDKYQKVLKNLTLRFPKSGLVSILGRSGSGKSTALNIIGGLLPADAGSVVYDGQPVVDGEAFRRSKVGFVFQDYNLIDHLCAVDNVISGMSDDVVDRRAFALQLLKDLNIEACASKYPPQLSGGQRQRLAIARMLAKDVAIILADEATSSLDRDNAELIMDILKGISAHKLVIFVTHDKKLAYQYSDRVVHLVDGQIRSDEIVGAGEPPSDDRVDGAPRAGNQPISYRKNRRYLPLKNLVGQRRATLRNIAIGALILLSIGLALFSESAVFKDYLHDIYLADGIKTTIWDVIDESAKEEKIVVAQSEIYRNLPNVAHIAYKYNTQIRLAGPDYIEGLTRNNPNLSFVDLEDITGNDYFAEILQVGRLPQRPTEVVMTAGGAIRLLKDLKIGGERLADQFRTGKLSVPYVFSLVEDRQFFVAEYGLPKIKIVGLVDDAKIGEAMATVYFSSGFSDLFTCRRDGLYRVGLKLYKSDLERQAHADLLAVAAQNNNIRIDDFQQKRVTIAYNKIASFLSFGKMLLTLICLIALFSLASLFYTSLLARRAEIIVYRSLGYCRRDIATIFGLELLYSGLLALVIAAAILAIVYNYVKMAS